MVEVENFFPVITLIFFVMSIGILLFFNFDIMHPAVITAIVMFFSLLLGTLNIDKWNLFIGSYTAVISLVGFLAFFAGSIFLQYNYFTKEQIPSKIYKKKYEVPFIIIVIATLLVLYLAYMSGKELYNLSLTLGNKDGVMNMIKTVRYPFERGEIEFSRWMRYRNIISMSIGTVFLYIYLYRSLLTTTGNKIKNLMYLFPVVAVIPFFFLSTGRRSLVEFIITGCVIANIFYQQKEGASEKVRLKVLKLLSIAGTISLIIYFSMGILTGKTQAGGNSLFSIIAHYGGLSVPALDYFFRTPFIENQYIGQNTMFSFYGNLNTLGFHLEAGKSFLPFVQFWGTDYVDTNVYTVLYRLISDWSIPGMLIVMVIFGALLSLCYSHLKYHTNPLLLIIYAHFGYIPFFLFIDDQFMTIFTTDNLWFIILCALLVHFAEIKNVCGKPLYEKERGRNRESA